MGTIAWMRAKLSKTKSITYESFAKEFNEDHDQKDNEHIELEMWEATKQIINEYPESVIWDKKLNYDETATFYYLHDARKLVKGVLDAIVKYKAMDAPTVESIGKAFIDTIMSDKKYVTSSRTVCHNFSDENR